MFDSRVRTFRLILPLCSIPSLWLCRDDHWITGRTLGGSHPPGSRDLSDGKQNNIPITFWLVLAGFYWLYMSSPKVFSDGRTWSAESRNKMCLHALLLLLVTPRLRRGSDGHNIGVGPVYSEAPSSQMVEDFYTSPEKKEWILTKIESFTR